MRNPIRLKNLNLRFLPLYLLGMGVLWLRPAGTGPWRLALFLILVGVALRTWGAGHLVKNHELTMTGPFAHLRHPLYAGTLLIATGFGLLLGGLWAVGAVLLIWPWFAFHYFPRKEASEYARLVERYGPVFERYWAAVPALWPRWRAWVAPANESGSSDRGGVWRLERYSDNNELGTLLAVIFGLALFWLRDAWHAV